MEFEFSHELTPPGHLPAVVLVHYGDFAPTLRCLKGLAEVETCPHEVWVVDNGSPGNLREHAQTAHPRVHVVEAPANLGFGAGCNLGAEAAFASGAPGVWFLNNDAEVETPLLDTFQAMALTHPRIALWGTWQRDGAQLLGSDRQKTWFCEGLAPFQGPEGLKCLLPHETLSGASIYISKAAWDRLGPWPEECFLYWEDAAWCRRAHAAGLGLCLLDGVITHRRGTTTGRRSPLTTFYGVRNMLRLHESCHPGARASHWKLALHLLQKRAFRLQWTQAWATWHGIQAWRKGECGRSSRY